MINTQLIKGNWYKITEAYEESYYICKYDYEDHANTLFFTDVKKYSTECAGGLFLYGFSTDNVLLGEYDLFGFPRTSRFFTVEDAQS